MAPGPKTYARIETPDGELRLSRREFEELRMTLGAVRSNHGPYPPQGHPRETVRKVWEFSTDHSGDDGYLSDRRPGRGGGA